MIRNDQWVVSATRVLHDKNLTSGIGRYGGKNSIPPGYEPSGGAGSVNS